jgi:enoyl-CoA hydratase/carnithine racemase
MQQAYRVLRVVAESQTIRMVLTLRPNELILKELRSACSALHMEYSRGIKAVVLDFKAGGEPRNTDHETVSPDVIKEAAKAVRAVESPVLAVVRGSISAEAGTLLQIADLILAAHDAVLPVGSMGDENNDTLTGAQALHLGYITWSVSGSAIDAEMTRILDMLRGKSAAALRLTKASIRLGAHAPTPTTAGGAAARLEALKQVNEFYLSKVMSTADAAEGLHAFLEKRKPRWKNA